VKALGIIVAIAVALAFSPWLIMLLVGALWHEFGWLQPISFWQAALIALVLSVIGSFFKSKSS
jgi:hypothetical protein